MLRDKYKAIDKLLENVASRFNGRLFQENNTMFSYILPVYTFGVHVGDNLVIVEEKHLGCLFRIESKLGSQLIVQTSSTDYMNEFLPRIKEKETTIKSTDSKYKVVKIVKKSNDIKK